LSRLRAYERRLDVSGDEPKELDTYVRLAWEPMVIGAIAGLGPGAASNPQAKRRLRQRCNCFAAPAARAMPRAVSAAHAALRAPVSPGSSATSSWPAARRIRAVSALPGPPSARRSLRRSVAAIRRTTSTPAQPRGSRSCTPVCALDVIADRWRSAPADMPQRRPGPLPPPPPNVSRRAASQNRAEFASAASLVLPRPN
jgi:hypothetical protein